MKDRKIITLTLNPAFDMHCITENFAAHQESFAKIVSLDIGGKGVNISRALKANGQDNVAVVVVGAENATEFCKALERDKISYIDVWTAGRIRENLTLHEEGKPETRISFNGFPCDESVLAKMEYRIGEVKEGTIVTFSGAIADGIEIDSVKRLLKKFQDCGAKIVVDSRSFAFEDLVELKPWLIKPNRTEAQNYLGREIKTTEDAVAIAKRFYEKGVKNVIVSLGDKGAVLVCKAGVYKAEVPKIASVSTIGAGDGVIAGFIDGYIKGYGIEDILKRAVAFGSAACLQLGTKPPRSEDIEELEKQITVTT